MAVATGAPQREFVDLQSSNPVFRGDGEGRWRTTSRDLVGVYDRTQDGRGTQAAACRASSIFVGADGRDWATTTGDANKAAGSGRPAQMAQDLHRLRGLAFARGGAWSQFALARTDADEGQPDSYPARRRVDKGYATGTHFDIGERGGTYETTYFEEICRPSIAGEEKPAT
jgi:hypothetical protein